MKNNIIGVTGFARSGKDTFYNYSTKALNRAKCYRYAFADALKEECDSFLQANLGISAFTEEAQEKELIRPFLVTYGTEIRRKLDPFCWIKKVEASIEENHPASDKNFIFITQRLLTLGCLDVVSSFHIPRLLAGLFFRLIRQQKSAP
mgnify:CR=1 FL=1